MLNDQEKARLPAWAEPHPSDTNAVLVDPDKAYPSLLSELGASEKIDRYWLEIAYQCVKMDLQTALRRYDFTIHIRSDDGRKDRWGFHAHKGTRGHAGKAVDDPLVIRATKGKEAREHYRRIRGFVPG